MIFLYIMCIVIYFIGIGLYLENVTTEIDFHKTYRINRSITPKDTRMSLLWPVLSVFWFIKITVFIFFCEILNFLFLVFGYTKYKNSKFYNFIDRKLG